MECRSVLFVGLGDCWRCYSRKFRSSGLQRRSQPTCREEDRFDEYSEEEYSKKNMQKEEYFDRNARPAS